MASQGRRGAGSLALAPSGQLFVSSRSNCFSIFDSKMEEPVRVATVSWKLYSYVRQRLSQKMYYGLEVLVLREPGQTMRKRYLVPVERWKYNDFYETFYSIQVYLNHEDITHFVRINPEQYTAFLGKDYDRFNSLEIKRYQFPVMICGGNPQLLKAELLSEEDFEFFLNRVLGVLDINMEPKEHPQLIYIPDIYDGEVIPEHFWEEGGLECLKEKFKPPVSPDPVKEKELYLCYLVIHGWAAVVQSSGCVRLQERGMSTLRVISSRPGQRKSSLVDSVLSTYSSIDRVFGGDTHHRTMTHAKCLTDQIMSVDDIRSSKSDEAQAMAAYDGASYVRGSFSANPVAPQIITSNNVKSLSGPVMQGRAINLVFPGDFEDALDSYQDDKPFFEVWKDDVAHCLKTRSKVQPIKLVRSWTKDHFNGQRTIHVEEAISTLAHHLPRRDDYRSCKSFKDILVGFYKLKEVLGDSIPFSINQFQDYFIHHVMRRMSDMTINSGPSDLPLNIERRVQDLPTLEDLVDDVITFLRAFDDTSDVAKLVKSQAKGLNLAVNRSTWGLSSTRFTLATISDVLHRFKAGMPSTTVGLKTCKPRCFYIKMEMISTPNQVKIKQILGVDLSAVVSAVSALSAIYLQNRRATANSGVASSVAASNFPAEASASQQSSSHSVSHLGAARFSMPYSANLSDLGASNFSALDDHTTQFYSAASSPHGEDHASPNTDTASDYADLQILDSVETFPGPSTARVPTTNSTSVNGPRLPILSTESLPATDQVHLPEETALPIVPSFHEDFQNVPTIMNEHLHQVVVDVTRTTNGNIVTPTTPSQFCRAWLEACADEAYNRQIMMPPPPNADTSIPDIGGFHPSARRRLQSQKSRASSVSSSTSIENSFEDDTGDGEHGKVSRQMSRVGMVGNPTSGQKSFSCDVCPKVYKTRAGMINHSKSHLPGDGPNEPLVCCKKTYKSTTTLENHKKKRHPENQTAQNNSEILKNAVPHDVSTSFRSLETAEIHEFVVGDLVYGTRGQQPYFPAQIIEKKEQTFVIMYLDSLRQTNNCVPNSMFPFDKTMYVQKLKTCTATQSKRFKFNTPILRERFFEAEQEATRLSLLPLEERVLQISTTKE